MSSDIIVHATGLYLHNQIRSLQSVVEDIVALDEKLDGINYVTEMTEQAIKNAKQNLETVKNLAVKEIGATVRAEAARFKVEPSLLLVAILGNDTRSLLRSEFF